MLYIPIKTRLGTLLGHGASWEEIGALYGVNKGVLWYFYNDDVKPKDAETRRKLGLIDTRPGAIRLAYPDHVNEHEERKWILDRLTPLERYEALKSAAEEKEAEQDYEEAIVLLEVISE